jgi:hypothetical protein
MAAQNCSDMLVKVCKQTVNLNKKNSNSYWVKQNITLYLIPKIYQAPPNPPKNCHKPQGQYPYPTLQILALPNNIQTLY